MCDVTLQFCIAFVCVVTTTHHQQGLAETSDAGLGQAEAADERERTVEWGLRSECGRFLGE